MRSFDDLSSDYDALLDDPLRRRFAGDSAFFIEQKCRAMLRELAPRGGGPILDAGCGQGVALAFLRRQSLSVIGTDISLPMLQEAASRGPVATLAPGEVVHDPGTCERCRNWGVAGVRGPGRGREPG